jgi:DNA-binding transcriptional LysR family regulator
VRLSLPPGYAHFVIAPIVTRFSAQHPQVIIEIDISSETRDFGTRLLDIVIRAAPSGRLTDSSLISHALDGPGAEFVCVASPEYLRATKPIRRPEDLEEHRGVIWSSRELRSLKLRHLDNGESIEVKPRPTLITSDLTFQQMLILEGAGVGFLPRTTIASFVSAGNLVVLLPEYVAGSVKAYLLHRRALSPNVRLFRDFVLRELREHGRLTIKSTGRGP